MKYFFSSLEYYLLWIAKYYPYVTPNWDTNTFCIQYMNGIQVTNPEGQKWNQLLDAVVKIIKYKKSQFFMQST